MPIVGHDEQPVNMFAYAFNDVAINLNQDLLIITSIKPELVNGR